MAECGICNKECEQLDCEHLYHIACLVENHKTECPDCGQEIPLNEEQYRTVTQHIPPPEDDNESVESDPSTLSVDFLELVSRLAQQDDGQNDRIEHKTIKLDGDGKPVVTVISIPQAYAAEYMNRMFGLPIGTDQPQPTPPLQPTPQPTPPLQPIPPLQQPAPQPALPHRMFPIFQASSFRPPQPQFHSEDVTIDWSIPVDWIPTGNHNVFQMEQPVHFSMPQQRPHIHPPPQTRGQHHSQCVCPWCVTSAHYHQ